MKNTLIAIAVAFALGWLIGWYPARGQRIEAESQFAAAERRALAAEQALAIAQFQNRAAIVYVQAEENDFASAGQSASALFTSLRNYTNGLEPGALKDALEKNLLARDPIIAGLAKADAAAKADLRSFFLQLQNLKPAEVQ